MQAMTEREAHDTLSGKVRVDDAYLGGERSGGKVGCGSENKVAFVVAVTVSDEGHPLRIKRNTVLGNLKTSLSGSYHSFGFSKYAEQYLGAFAYRFNRRFDLETLAQRLLVAAAKCGS